MSALGEFKNELENYKIKNNKKNINEFSDEIKELFVKKLLIIITNGDYHKFEIEELIDKDSFFEKYFRATKAGVNMYDTIDKGYSMWLRKKMLELSIKGKKYSEDIILDNFKKEKNLSCDNKELKKLIFEGKVILENNYILYSYKTEEKKGDEINDKKVKAKKNIEKSLNNIIKLIFNNFKSYGHFEIEYIDNINEEINKIKKYLINFQDTRGNERIEFEMSRLKLELMKGFNSDESSIKSILYKIQQLINYL